MSLYSKLRQLKSFGWPPDEYVVFGSTPLAIRGIRPADDVDVVASSSLWTRLTLVHEHLSLHRGVEHMHIGPIEVLSGWWPYVGEANDIVRAGQLVDDIPFAPLELVLHWKRISNRPKDVADARLIEAYLSERAAAVRRPSWDHHD